MDKRGIIVALILTLMLGLFLGYKFSISKETSYLEKTYDSLGWEFYREGKYDEAMKEFRKYIDGDKDNYVAHTGLGWSLYRKGIYDEALSSFQTAIALNKNDYMPYSGLGWSDYHLLKFQEAIDNFEKALELNQLAYEVYSGLGWSHYSINFTEHVWEYKEKNRDKLLNNSADYFKKAIELNQYDWDSYHGLGSSYFWKARESRNVADYEPAIDALRKAAELNPQNPGTHETLGFAIYYSEVRKPENQRDYTEAINSFNNALKLNQDSWNSYMGLGLIYFQIGEEEEGNYLKAIENFEKAIQINPEHGALYDFIGWSYYRLSYDHHRDYYDEAIISFRKSLEIDEHHIYSHNGIGWVLNRQRKYNESIIEFNSVLQKDPTDIDATSGLAFAYWLSGNLDLASEVMEKAVDLDPYNADNHEFLGSIYLEQDRLAEAKEHFLFAVNNLGHHHAHGYRDLGAYYYYSLKNYEEALSYYLHAAEVEPKNPQNHINLGGAYYHLKDYSNSITSFNEALQLNPEIGQAFVSYLGLALVYVETGDTIKAEEVLGKLSDIMGENRPVLENSASFRKFSQCIGLEELNSSNIVRCRLG